MCVVMSSQEGNEGDSENEHRSPFLAGSRDVTEKLLELTNDDMNSTCEQFGYCVDWSEAVSGWKLESPNPKYVTTSRKRKPLENGEMFGIIRCINDDESDHYLKFWRTAVEPTTFRYVPNNCQYRLSKFSQIDGSWYTVRSMKPEKVATRNAGISKSNRESRSKKRSPRKRPEARSRSTNSDGAITRRTKVANLLPNHPEPLKKSASDLFMENLDSKLSQVEHHVKQKMQNKKNIVNEYPEEKEEQRFIRPKTKNMTVSFEAIVASVDSPCDTCSVTSSTVSKSLRPLEKVTPKQRIQVGISPNSNNLPKNNFSDSPSLNVGSSIVFEGIETQLLKNVENLPQSDSYLVGKANNVSKTKKSTFSNPINKKGAILRYTTSSSSNSNTKDKMWDPSSTNGNVVVSGLFGELPEVSGKQISVSVTTQRLLRQ